MKSFTEMLTIFRRWAYRVMNGVHRDVRRGLLVHQRCVKELRRRGEDKSYVMSDDVIATAVRLDDDDDDDDEEFMIRRCHALQQLRGERSSICLRYDTRLARCIVCMGRMKEYDDETKGHVVMYRAEILEGDDKEEEEDLVAVDYDVMCIDAGACSHAPGERVAGRVPVKAYEISGIPRRIGGEKLESIERAIVGRCRALSPPSLRRHRRNSR